MIEFYGSHDSEWHTSIEMTCRSFTRYPAFIINTIIHCRTMNKMYHANSTAYSSTDLSLSEIEHLAPTIAFCAALLLVGILLLFFRLFYQLTEDDDDAEATFDLENLATHRAYLESRTSSTETSVCLSGSNDCSLCNRHHVTCYDNRPPPYSPPPSYKDASEMNVQFLL